MPMIDVYAVGGTLPITASFFATKEDEYERTAIR